MPGLLIPSLTADMRFNIHPSKLDHDYKQYATYVEGRLPPLANSIIKITDLRDDADVWEDPVKSMEERGYAALVHESKYLNGELETPEGVELYNEETCELVKKALGATRVVVWNNVHRKNVPDAFFPTKEAIQQAPEKGFVPSTVIKKTVSAAHIDTNPPQGRANAQRTLGADAIEKFKRVQVMNLWRPLKGPVTNGQLAVLDWRSLDLSNNTYVQASVYGTGYGISHNENQKWSYISRQMPNEVYLLKSWDSHEGKDGSAEHAGHSACEVIGEPKVEGEELVPRESLESRLVAVWE